MESSTDLLAVFFAAILAPIYLFLIPSFDPCPGVSVAGRLVKFDFLGSLLSIGAIVCLIMGINFGGVLYDWNSGSIIALFVISGALFIVFAIQQIFTIFTTEDNRLFPVHLVQRKEPILLFIAGASGGAAIYLVLYYIPLYFQFTRGDSAIKAAVRLLPFVFILSAMVLANGFFMAKFGRYTPWYIVGSIVMMIGSVLLCELISRHIQLSGEICLRRLSQDRRQHLGLSNIWLRGNGSLRRRLLRPSIFLRHSNHRDPRRDVLWDHPNASR